MILELNKKIQLYGQAVVDTTELNTINNIVKSNKALKFNVKNLTYKDKIVLQVEDICEKKKIKTYDNKVKHITIVCVDVDKDKTEMNTIIDAINITGLESFSNYTRLNPISITFNNNELIRYLTYSKRCKYRFIPRGLLFSASFTNDTQVIHLICDGLSGAKSSVLNGKIYKTLGQINLCEIENWEKLKKHQNWVYAQFRNLFNVQFGVKHLSYPFATAILTDILDFDLTLVDNSNKPLEFAKDEKRVPSFNFDIQIIK